jgi:hypothetical protein
MSGLIRRLDRQGCSAAVAGVGVAGLEPIDAGVSPMILAGVSGPQPGRARRAGASCWVVSSVCAGEHPECRAVASAAPPAGGPPGYPLGPAWRGCVARRSFGATAPRSPRSAPPGRHQPWPALTVSADAVIEGGHRFADGGEQRRNPRRCDDALPQTSRPAPGRVGLLGEKRARQPLNLVGALQLRVLPAEPPQLFGVGAGQPVTPHAAVRLSCRTHLPNVPVPIPSSRATSAIVRTLRRPIQIDRASLELRGELARSGHNQLLPWPNKTKIESLQKSGGTSPVDPRGPAAAQLIAATKSHKTLERTRRAASYFHWGKRWIWSGR